jgi:hypothetical protein
MTFLNVSLVFADRLIGRLIGLLIGRLIGGL